MKQTFLLSSLLLAASLGAAEFLLEPAKAEAGAKAPQIVTDAFGASLKFTASAMDAAAAKIPQNFDFRQGGRVELEFQDEAVQTNPFPRLLEAGSISLHFQADPNSKDGDKMLKVLLNDASTRGYDQIMLPSPYKAGAWHKVVFAVDPAAGRCTLQLDDAPAQSAVLNVSPKLDKLQFLLGATALAKSSRGFNGSIRNVKITTPFAIDGAGQEAELSNKPVSPGVRHTVISAVKGRHLAFPGVAKLPGGDLAAVFREGEAHVCPYGRICIVYSKDGGRNWSAPVAVADTETDERDPSIQTLSDGRVLLTHGGWNSWMFYGNTAGEFPQETAYIRQAGPEKFGGSHYLFSDDGGRTFGRPVKVPGFAPHGPAVAADGTLYQPSLGNDGGKRQVYFYRGTPDAKNWQRIGTVAEMPKKSGMLAALYEEPHTAILPDGTFVTAIRVPSPVDGYMRISFSHDQGRSWSEPVKTPVRGYPQHLLVLKDGRLLATYGYRYQPMGVRACVSRDGGKTWDIDREIVLRNDGVNGDLGYPVSIELDNGEVLAVYYMSDKEHDNCFIEGAFFRP